MLRSAAFVLATVFAAAPGPSTTPPGGLPLPPARGPLVFEPGAKEIGFDELLQAFAQLTGQELTFGPQDAQMLAQMREPLENPAPVPTEEVYTFVEGLLARQSVVIVPLTGGTRPILGVYATGGGRSVAPEPLHVSSEHLPELAAHPALHVRLLFPLQHIDARQVQTQLRQITVDPANITQCVPVGELALILQGRAREVAGLAQVLKAADEHAGRTRLPVAPQASGEGEK